jgi:prepilin-type N-terminal cleavage/methylation domain-containing protein
MNRRGFSLTELLVVIVIIATLAGMLLGGMVLVRENVRRTAAVQRIGELHAALENYRGEDMRHRYPVPLPAATPWLRCDPDFVLVPDPARPRQRNHAVEVLDMLAERGLTWDPQSIADGILVDPWRHPYRYQVDDGQAAAPWKPAPLQAWNPDGLRPFAYVWSLGKAGNDDLGKADGWIIRQAGTVR